MHTNRLFIACGLILTILSAGHECKSADDAQAGAVLARHHLAFAKQLAAAGIKFDDDYLQWADAHLDHYCEAGPGVSAPATEQEQAKLNLFVDEYCMPWRRFWDHGAACRGHDQPDWCSNPDATARHFGFRDYFRLLSGAIAASEDPATQDVVMWILVQSLTPHVVMQFEEEDTAIAKAVAPGLTVYLRRVGPAPAIEIVRAFQNTSLGLADPLAHEVSTYARGLSKESAHERDALLKMAKERYSDVSSGE